ncbi:hypothetical protein [Hoeflea sp. TYP-13]|uniref:hypothetical protein n=1 Tax=Hoeflea sp. TYP-13 TaxID=3230023 RepID=UPI0034C5FDA1
MDRFLLFFIRLIMITIGFVAASLAAGIALAFLTRIITPPEAAQLSDAGLGAGLVIAAFAFSSMTGYVAFFPAMIIILYSEFTRRRDWLFYALTGGAIAAIAPLIITVIRSTGRPTDFEFLFMSIATGMIGGLAYWLVAGRSAGNWLPVQRPAD